MQLESLYSKHNNFHEKHKLNEIKWKNIHAEILVFGMLNFLYLNTKRQKLLTSCVAFIIVK